MGRLLVIALSLVAAAWSARVAPAVQQNAWTNPLPGTWANRHPDGPPPAHTGGFGEKTCTDCHFGGAPTGSATLTGLPDSWEPGRTYRLSLILHSTSMERAGFQLSARFPDGSQAGTLKSVTDRVAFSLHQGVQYAAHTEAGSWAGADSALWSLLWVAPEKTDSVQFNAALNAGNGDNSPLGDAVQTLEVRVAPPTN